MRAPPAPLRPSVSAPVAVATLAVLLSLLPIVAVALGGAGSTGWLHRWCSPGALTAAGGGLGHQVLAFATIHWPHFLPALIGIATLVYLRRADRRYRAAQRSGA